MPHGGSVNVRCALRVPLHGIPIVPASPALSRPCSARVSVAGRQVPAELPLASYAPGVCTPSRACTSAAMASASAWGMGD